MDLDPRSHYNPRLTRLVCIVCSLGLFIDGYVLYISSIAIPFIDASFHPEPFMLGIIQAAAPVGAAIGAITMGRVADKIGRKSMLIFNLVFFVVITSLSSLAWSAASLVVFRFLIGLGVGMDYPICASYMAEMTPPGKTGKVMATSMFINCIASPVGVLVAWGIYTLDPSVSAWRWMFLSGAIPAVVALVIRARLPESFLWKAHKRLLSTSPDAEHKTNDFQQIFSRKTYLKATIGVCAAWFLMDIAYYGVALFTPSILSALNISGDGNFMTSVSEVIKSTLYLNTIVCLGAFFSIFLISKIDSVRLQRICFLLSFVGLFLLTFSSGFGHGTNTALIFIGFIIFNFFVNLGPGVTTYLIPAKIYPTSIRGTGHGFASGVGKIGAFVGALIVPVLQSWIGIYLTVFVLSLTLLGGFFASYLITGEPVKSRAVNARQKNKNISSSQANGVQYELS